MEAKGSLMTINIDGKPLEKLIDAVSKGIGTLYRPRQIRKEADAQAYAIKVLEKAKAEAGADSMLIEADTVERIGQRLVAQEIRRQNNIDTVVEAAADDLKGKDVSDEPVNEDWATRFFGIVQDVSQKEMKTIWAKILAKEIEKPSSYSLRTLELLRNISYEEAELFTKLSDFVIKQSGCFVFSGDDVLEKYGLKYIDQARLREAGFLQSGELVTRTYNSARNSIIHSNMIYGNLILQITIPPQTNNIQIPILLLTQAGCEIFELIKPKENLNYLKDIVTFIRKKNPKVKIQYANIIERNGTQIRYVTPMKDV
jgi:hypothetical protein